MSYYLLPVSIHPPASGPPRLLDDARPTAREAVARLLIAAAPQRAASVDGELQTPLHRAAACGHLGALRLLVAAAPAAAALPDLWGSLPLHWAARVPGGAAAVAALLAAAPWAARTPNGSGETPLLLAAEADEASALALLAAAPAAAALPAGDRSPHARCLPLHVAARFGRPALVAALLETAPASASRAGLHDQLPLHYAAAGRQPGHHAVRRMVRGRRRPARRGVAALRGRPVLPLSPFRLKHPCTAETVASRP